MQVTPNLATSPREAGCPTATPAPALVIENLAEFTFSGMAQPTFSIADVDRDYAA